MKKEGKEGSEMEERTESAAERKAEGDSPKESSDEGVTVSEEYQKKAHEVTHKATKHHLSHLQSKMDDRRAEISKEEEKGKKEPSKGVDEFNADSSY